MKFQLCILLLFPFLTFSQLSDKVNVIYQELNSKSSIESQNIGYSGTESNSYKMYEELDSIANDDEVLYMAQNGNNIVKGYLSAILVDRKSKNLSQLFTNYIKKDERVHIQTGCTGYSSTIGGELYSYLFYQKEKLKFINATETGFEETKAYEKEIEGENFIKKYQSRWTNHSIDSLLTQFNEVAINYDSILPQTLDKIFRLNDYKFDNYKRVKYFANKYPTREIMATLANFRKKSDLSLFLKNIDNALLSISRFPDKSFIQILENKYETNTDNLDYYEAISSFCNDEVNKIKNNIYEKFVNSKDIFAQEYLQYFEESLKKYNCEFNKELISKIENSNNR